MKKIFKKVIVAASVVFGIGTSAATVVVLNSTGVKAKGNVVLNNNNSETLKEDLKDFDYRKYCNNTYESKEVNYEITTAEEFLEDFNSSLENFSNNGSWLMYSDAKDEIPYMLGYIEGLGNIKGMRESTCGDNEYSSWVYVIENKFYSRITLSSSKLEGFEMLPANSNFYYSVDTWYSNEDEVEMPKFYILDGEVINLYQKFKKDNLKVNVKTPTFNFNSYQAFEGDFSGLEKNTTKMYGVSNSNYNRNKFSYENLDEVLVTNFNNFWSVKSLTEDIYLMNGKYAEAQMKKLLISMFSNGMQPCNDFTNDCVKSKEEVCTELGSYYNLNSIQSQFFAFDFDFVTEEYYENNISSCDDKNNYGYHNMSQKEYEEMEEKPSLTVYEKGGNESVIDFSVYVSNTKVNIVE